MQILEKNDLKKCVEILSANELLAFPTETVFGLGIKATSEENYLKLVKAKKRPSDKPFTLMCSEVEDFDKICEINELTQKIIKKFMPGPITLILKTKKDVPHFLDLGSGYVGVRIPDDKFILKMISEVGSPLLVPSANISSFPPAKNEKEVVAYFGDEIGGVVKGECSNGVASSIFKIENSNIIELRKGPISLNDVLEACKQWQL